MKAKAPFFIPAFLVHAFFVMTGIASVSGQTSTEILSKAFDASIGRENLPISNGTVHYNPYRISNNRHYYYPSDRFEKGIVKYNGQEYFDAYILYDTYKDLLLYKIRESDLVSINLIPEKATAFTLNKRNFVFISSSQFPLSQIKTGYYEENLSSIHFHFYIRHHRDKREVLKGTTAFAEFDDNYSFYIRKEDAFYEITSRKDVIRLFPEYKRKINDFHAANRNLERTDSPLFYEKLMAYLNNSIENATH
jgi:hypothetical protein